MCQVADGLDDETAVMSEEKCFCLLGPGEEIFLPEVMCGLGSASESPKVDRNGWSYNWSGIGYDASFKRVLGNSLHYSLSISVGV